MFKLKPHHLFTAILASLLLFCAVPDVAAQNQITPRKQTHQTQPKKRTPAKKNNTSTNKPKHDPIASQTVNSPDDNETWYYGVVNTHDFECDTHYNNYGSKAIKITFKLNTYRIGTKPIFWRADLKNEDGTPVANYNFYGRVFEPKEELRDEEMHVIIPYDMMPDTFGLQQNFIVELIFSIPNIGKDIENTGTGRYNFSFLKN